MNNNSFLKRQKELKRKEKQKEKEIRKAARKQGQGSGDESEVELALDASGLTGVGPDGASAVVPGLVPSASGDSVVRAVGEPAKD